MVRRIGGAGIRLTCMALFVASWVSGCGQSNDTTQATAPDASVVPAAPVAKAVALVKGAHISGANGLHFSKDGLLYVGRCSARNWSY